MKPSSISFPPAAGSLRRALILTALCTGTGFSQSPAVSEAAADDRAATELAPMVVEASADASAAGLTEAYAGGQVARGGRVGLLGSLDYMETPFSLTAYTEDLIENQQAQSIGDVLLNDPAVRVARGFGNFQQVYLVRGLPVFSDDMTYNGLFGLLPRQYLAAELVERVEVFRGANAFLNGAAPGGSSLGGTVNVLPKRAGNDPLREVTVGIQSGGHTHGAFDVGERVLDGQLGVRLNGLLRGGDTAVDGESIDLGLLALGLDWRGERVRLSADFGVQKLEREGSQPNVTFAAGVPILSAPDASESFAQPWTYSDARDVFGVFRAEFDINDCWTVWGAIGGREGEEENSLANPTVIDTAGNTSSFRFDNYREDTVWTGEIGVRGDLRYGAVRHRPTFSYTAFQLESKNAFAFSNFAGFANNLYNPTRVTPPPADAFLGGVLSAPRVTEETDTSSFAAADIISLFDEKLVLLGGVRYQTIETRSFDATSGARTAAYDESEVTPMAGVLYQFTPRISGYANYIEGLTKGDIAPTTSGGVPVANAGEALDPYVTEQFEAGVKFDYDRIGATLGVFQSEKPVAGLTASGDFDVLYEQRYRGVELTTFGAPHDSVRVLGGVSLLDTERGGNDQIGSPDAQFTLSGEWDLPFLTGLTLDGRVIHTESQFADAANTQKVPSWTRFDLGLRYITELPGGQELTLRARVENVADDDYWASAGGFPGAGYLTIGAPRTLMFSASCSF